MPTFRMLCEAMEKEGDKMYVDKGSLLGDGEPNNNADKAIRIGLQLSDSLEEGETFWDTFIKVFKGDADALADLLHVPRHKVAAMPHRVHEALRIYRKQNEGEDKKKKGKKQRSEMIQTGNTPYSLNSQTPEQPTLGPTDNPAQTGNFSNMR